MDKLNLDGIVGIDKSPMFRSIARAKYAVEFGLRAGKAVCEASKVFNKFK